MTINEVRLAVLHTAADVVKLKNINVLVTVRVLSNLFKSTACILLGLSAVVYSKPAIAAMIVNATESGGDVVFSYGGSVNTTGLTQIATMVNTNYFQVIPDFNGNGFLVNGGSSTSLGVWSTSSSFLPYGTNTSGLLANTYYGDVFGFGFAAFASGGELYLPASYSSGNLSGSATFTGMSFSSLGMTTGTYVNTLSNNETVTLNVGTVPVPGPLPILSIPTALLFSRKLKARIRARRNISSSALA